MIPLQFKKNVNTTKSSSNKSKSKPSKKIAEIMDIYTQGTLHSGRISNKPKLVNNFFTKKSGSQKPVIELIQQLKNRKSKNFIKSNIKNQTSARESKKKSTPLNKFSDQKMNTVGMINYTEANKKTQNFFQFQTHENGLTGQNSQIYEKTSSNILESKLPINLPNELDWFRQEKNFKKNQKKTFLDQYDFLSKTFGKSVTLNNNKKVESCSNSIQRQKLEWKQNNGPLSVQQVLLHYSHYLTKDEKSEIKSYKQIYFLGHKVKKREQIGFEVPNYDNEEKQYKYCLGDHIAYRYELIQFVGKGSYGQVFKVFDHKKKQYQALKIIRNKKKITKQAYIQINILLAIKQHDRQNMSGIVKIKDFVEFRKHVCIIFQLLSQNLYQLIKKNDYNGLQMQLIRRFAIQILNSLKFLKDYRIIHCDLKPQNILLKQPNKSGIKIIDFGSSCFEHQILYSYIQSRYYRAPQITLNIKYDSMIDMWSFGCILVELYIGAPLFPGQNQFQQMAYMIKTLGLPPQKLLNKAQRKSVFFNQDMTYKQDLINAKLTHGFGRPLKQIINQKDKSFLQFLENILKWQAQSRLTPSQALKSKWILQGLPQQVKNVHRLLNNQEGKSKRSGKQIQMKGKKSKSKQRQIIQKSKSNKSKSKSKQTSLKIKQSIKQQEQLKRENNSIPIKIKLNLSNRSKILKGDTEGDLNVKFQQKIKKAKQFFK